MPGEKIATGSAAELDHLSAGVRWQKPHDVEVESWKLKKVAGDNTVKEPVSACGCNLLSY